MKLISFAALSFLAITVSALPGPGTPHQSTTTQSALQHQSTTTQSALQHQSTGTPSAQRHQLARSRSAQDRYKQSLQAESEILREQYRENRALACKMKALINAIEKELLELRRSIKEFEESSLEQEEMAARLLSRTSDIGAARDSLKVARQGMKDAEEQYNTAKGKLASLSEF